MEKTTKRAPRSESKDESMEEAQPNESETEWRPRAERKTLVWPEAFAGDVILTHAEQVYLNNKV